MKKIATLFLIGFALGAFAQGISLTNPSINITGHDTDAQLVAKVSVVNLLTKDLAIICERTVTDTAPGHITSFCWGNKTVANCYPSLVSKSPTPGYFVTAGSTNNDFQSDVSPMGFPGTSTITYRFYNGANPLSDTATITFKYTILPTGINEIEKKATLSVPYPNPADQLATVAYSVNELSSAYSVDIYDMLGSLISSHKIDSKNGALLIPTSALPTSIYIVAFKHNSQILSSQKLIVAHKQL